MNPFVASLFAFLVLASQGSFAAELFGQSRTKTKAQLVLERDMIRPGGTVTAAVVLTMPPGWHTYWQHPGESGGATEIAWELPPGITAGNIQWPTPEKYVDSDITTYIYHDEAALLVELRAEDAIAPGEYPLKAKVNWLECEKVCVMGSGRISGRLVIGAADGEARLGSRFEVWRQRLPSKSSDAAVEAGWEARGTNRVLHIDWSPPTGVEQFDFYPLPPQDVEVAGATSPAVKQGRGLRISKEIKTARGQWPETLAGVLAWKEASGGVRGWSVTLTPKGIKSTGAGGPAGGANADRAGSSRGLPVWMAFAVLGGFILNFMPCVLPVIALKVLGFVGHGGASKSETRKLGLIYGLGVWVSFLVLAGVVIAVKKAGMAASWGMQFQNPIMLVCLTTLVMLVGLNLFGVFEVTVGGGALGAAGQLASKEGSVGAFFNGVLATVLATPCTAPFLGAALGFAFTQPSSVTVLIFSCVALGLAAPYVALCWEPAWLKFLPKPGLWMERFKIAMGFPMIATAVWLFTLAADFYGDGGDLWLGLFLVLVALAAWIWGAFVQRGSSRRSLSMGLSLLIAGLAWGWILESEIQWRKPASRKLTGIPWQPWSHEAVAQARREGRPVFVDFTAKWCLTCKLNKRRAIEVDAVRKKLKEINAVALAENSPEKSEEIVAELNKHGRAGVPLNLVYPKDASKPPIVLPELLLTPDVVLQALDQASK